MRTSALISGLLLIVSSVAVTAIQAQTQPAPAAAPTASGPVGVAPDAHSTPASDADVSTDYPRDQAGVLIQAEDWKAVANQNPTRTRAAHSFAASVSYGVVPVKIVAEYAGEHAPTVVAAGRPVLCLCHFFSIPGDPVLVRLHAKKDTRELDGGRMIVYPIVGGSKMADANKTDLIPADVSHPDPQVWLIRPQSQLEPGEYALMLGTQNLSIFPFTVAPAPTAPSDAK
ncbi:MAG TPA: hypothetical protein VMT38_02300 [Terracidiphilus sp.]|nr:hypothetical protein [Terracidiphilus sp.]